MKTAKEEILGLLEILPDEMALDDILDRIEFKARILHSQEQAARGDGVPHEEVKEILDQWLESLGHRTLSPTSKK